MFLVLRFLEDNLSAFKTVCCGSCHFKWIWNLEQLCAGGLLPAGQQKTQYSAGAFGLLSAVCGRTLEPYGGNRRHCGDPRYLYFLNFSEKFNERTYRRCFKGIGTVNAGFHED